MEQYISKDALVAEIERRLTSYKDEIGKYSPFQHNLVYDIIGKKEECKDILSFIDTLEVKEINEKPVSEEFKEVIEEYATKRLRDPELCLEYIYFELINAVKYGVNLQKEYMMSKAIDGVVTFDYYGDGDKTYGCIAHDSFCLEDFGLKDNDMIKMVLIKKD